MKAHTYLRRFKDILTAFDVLCRHNYPKCAKFVCKIG